MQSQSTCPKCGALSNGNQRFCSECGTILDVEAAKPTARASGQEYTQYSASTPPPPPPPGAYPDATPGGGAFSSPSLGSYGSGSSPQYPAQPPEGAYMPPPQQQSYQTPVPDFARPQRNASRGVFRGLGCGVLALVLVVLAVLGGLGYGGYLLLSHAGKGSTSSTTHQGNSTVVAGNTPTSGQDVTPTAIPAQTVTFGNNMSVTYATIDLTFTTVQQAQSFPDDSSTNGNPSTVRVNFKEANNTAHGVGFAYPDVARLVLPDQSIVTPENYKNLEPPASSSNAVNWLDFSVPTSVSISASQLILRLGTAAEAQMSIPLQAGADLTVFQTKTITPTNAQVTYAGLKWTITKATLGWSANSQQAKAKQRFVTVTVTVDNPGTSGVQGYYGDYIRLKAGSQTSTPEDDATIPLGFAAGSSGNTGYASFAVPDDVTSFTFVLLVNASTGATQQATIDFQIA